MSALAFHTSVCCMPWMLQYSHILIKHFFHSCTCVFVIFGATRCEFKINYVVSVRWRTHKQLFTQLCSQVSLYINFHINFFCLFLCLFVCFLLHHKMEISSYFPSHMTQLQVNWMHNYSTTCIFLIMTSSVTRKLYVC